MPEYRSPPTQEAERLDAAAEASSAEVQRDIQRASNYVLTVVLYAVVLFFAGMSTKIANRRLRWVLTIAGYIVLLAALAWIATFPVSVQGLIRRRSSYGRLAAVPAPKSLTEQATATPRGRSSAAPPAPRAGRRPTSDTSSSEPSSARAASPALLSIRSAILRVDGLRGDHPPGGDRLLLADPVHAVDGLRLLGVGPGELGEHDVRGDLQVDARRRR